MKINICLNTMSNLLLLIAVFIGTVQALWTDFEWVSIENSKGGIGKTDVMMKRYNRSTYTLSGTAEITDFFKDDGYDCELKAYYSSKGNNQFVLLPYKIKRDSCCNFFESPYWKAVEASLLNTSDFPKRNGNEPYCPLFEKRVYTINNLVADKTIIVKYLEPGSYKGEFFIYDKLSNDVSSMVSGICRLY